MFKITIEAVSMTQLATMALALANQFGDAPAPAENTPAEPTKPAARKPAAKKAEPVAVDETDRELLAAVEPAPATANSIVDAGTGQPAAAQPTQMTIEDVKVAATKLAGVDMPTLSQLITKHGGDKLSTIPPQNLGDFASDVLEALALA